MILHLLAQIFIGAIALIPVFLCVILFGWSIKRVFTSSFRYDPSYTESSKAISIVEKTVKIVSGILGFIVGYLILTEILNLFVQWGWMSSVKPHLTYILSSWVVIAIVLASYFVIRFMGWLTWKLIFKRNPIREKAAQLRSNGVEGGQPTTQQGLAILPAIAIVACIALAIMACIWTANEQSQNENVMDRTMSTVASQTTSMLGIH